jgi:hypothetical protein
VGQKEEKRDEGIEHGQDGGRIWGPFLLAMLMRRGAAGLSTSFFLTMNRGSRRDGVDEWLGA